MKNTYASAIPSLLLMGCLGACSGARGDLLPASAVSLPVDASVCARLADLQAAASIGLSANASALVATCPDR